MTGTCGLSDRPKQAEISDRCSNGGGAAFKEHDAAAHSCRRQGVGKTDNTAANYGHVRFPVAHGHEKWGRNPRRANALACRH
jgi:hypothetical protein